MLARTPCVPLAQLPTGCGSLYWHDHGALPGQAGRGHADESMARQRQQVKSWANLLAFTLSGNGHTDTVDLWYGRHR
jgi:hypothetical protein